MFLASEAMTLLLLSLVSGAMGHAIMTIPVSRNKLLCGKVPYIPFINDCAVDGESGFGRWLLDPLSGVPYPTPPAMRPGKYIPWGNAGAGTASKRQRGPHQLCSNGIRLGTKLNKALNTPGPKHTWTHYKPGEIVKMRWLYLLPHLGVYSYRLCLDGSDTEECFQKTILENVHGKKWMPVHRILTYTDDMKIPHGLKEGRYTLSWRWDALIEPSIFINCADVYISTDGGRRRRRRRTKVSMPEPVPHRPNEIKLEGNKCIQVSKFAVSEPINGDKLWIGDCDGGDNQMWEVHGHQIRWKKNTSKCVDLPGNNMTNGNQLQIWDCIENAPQQAWVYEGSDTGHIFLQNTSKCLFPSHGDITKGSEVQSWDCHDYAQIQKWTVWDPFQITLKDHPGMCLELPGGSTHNGNKVWLFNCSNVDNQLWILTPGSFKIVYAADTSKCLDLPGGKASKGNELQIWDCNGGPSQSWGFGTHDDNIYYKPKSNMCLDLPGGDFSAYPPHYLRIWGCTGNSNQRWSMSRADWSRTFTPADHHGTRGFTPVNHSSIHSPYFLI